MVETRLLAKSMAEQIENLKDFLDSKGIKSNWYLPLDDVQSVIDDTVWIAKYEEVIGETEINQLSNDLDFVGRGLKGMINSEKYTDIQEELEGYFTIFQTISNSF
jgi:hypothetical protein